MVLLQLRELQWHHIDACALKSLPTVPDVLGSQINMPYDLGNYSNLTANSSLVQVLYCFINLIKKIALLPLL